MVPKLEVAWNSVLEAGVPAVAWCSVHFLAARRSESGRGVGRLKGRSLELASSCLLLSGFFLFLFNWDFLRNPVLRS